MYHLTFFCLSLIIIQWTSTTQLHPRVYDAQILQANVNQYLVYLDIYVLKSVRSCSGSILSKRWVISAAHCVEGNILHVQVQKSQYKRVHTDVVPFLKLIAEVDKSGITVHPDYVQGLGTYQNLEQDLALLKTTKEILFDEFTKPIRLTRNRSQIGQAAILAGYGNSEHGASMPRMGSAILTKCLYADNDSKLLCTFSTVRAGSGDSGGPLVMKDRLVGVISAGSENEHIHKNCETYYVDVTQQLDWIKNITGVQNKL